jgi:hypothetical protein
MDAVLETVNVTADGGLVKQIYARGTPGTEPKTGDLVTGASVVTPVCWRATQPSSRCVWVCLCRGAA